MGAPTLELRHTRTGEVLPPMSTSEALVYLGTNTYEPTDPEAAVPYYAQDEAGQQVIRTIPARLLTSANAQHNFSLPLVTDVAHAGRTHMAAADRALRANFAENEGTQAFVNSALDTVSFGGASLAQNAVDPHGQRVRQMATEENAIEDTAGMFAGLLGPSAVGSLAARTGIMGTQAAARVGATGVMGLGRAAGQASGRVATAGVEVAGLAGTRAGNIAVRGAELVGEELAASVALETSIAIRQNRELSGSIIAADTGFGVLAGMGTMGLFTLTGKAGSRFRNRARATPASREATAGIMEADTLSREGVVPADLLDPPAPGHEAPSTLAQASGHVSAQDPQLIQYFAHEGNALAAKNADTALPPLQARAAAAVDELHNTQQPRVVEAFANTDYLDGMSPHFSRVDTTSSIAPLAQSVDAMITRIAAYGNDVVRRVDGRVTREFVPHSTTVKTKHGLKLIEERLRELQEVRRLLPTGDGRQAYELMERLRRGANNSRKGDLAATLDSSESGLLGDLGAMARDNRKNPAIWGEEIARVETVRSENIHLYGQAQDTIKKLVNDNTIGQVTSEKMQTLIRKNARDHGSRYESLQNALADQSRALRQLDELGLVPPGSATSSRAAGEEALDAMASGSHYAEAQSKLNALEGGANTSAGGINVPGMMSAGTGAIAGGVAGSFAGPVGAVLGGIAGGAATVMWKGLSRPGSTLVRFHSTHASIRNFVGRFDKGIAAVKKSLSSAGGFSTRGIRHGVKAYYSLEGGRKQRQEEFEQIRTDLLELQNHPQLLQDRLAITTAPFSDVDPGLGLHTTLTAVAGYSYLLEKMPRPPVNPFTPNELSFPPSQTEMDTFIRRYGAVSDPLVVLERFAQNRLTIEEVEAVQRVHPAIYGQMVAAIAGEMAEMDQASIPFQAKVQTSIMFGLEGHYTLGASFGAAMQNNGAQTEQQAQAVTTQGSNAPPSVTNSLTRTQQTLNEAPL